MNYLFFFLATIYLLPLSVFSVQVLQKDRHKKEAIGETESVKTKTAAKTDLDEQDMYMLKLSSEALRLRNDQKDEKLLQQRLAKVKEVGARMEDTNNAAFGVEPQAKQEVQATAKQQAQGAQAKKQDAEQATDDAYQRFLKKRADDYNWAEGGEAGGDWLNDHDAAKDLYGDDPPDGFVDPIFSSRATSVAEITKKTSSTTEERRDEDLVLKQGLILKRADRDSVLVTATSSESGSADGSASAGQTKHYPTFASACDACTGVPNDADTCFVGVCRDGTAGKKAERVPGRSGVCCWDITPGAGFKKCYELPTILSPPNFTLPLITRGSNIHNENPSVWYNPSNL